MKYRTFQPQFHAPIRAGIKISTIRGKAWAKVGERVALRYWTGRPYGSRMGVLGTAVVDQVARIAITYGGPLLDPDGGCIAIDEERLATIEGFRSWSEMRAWFEKVHGLDRPYLGTATSWDPKTLELVDVPQDGVKE